MEIQTDNLRDLIKVLQMVKQTEQKTVGIFEGSTLLGVTYETEEVGPVLREHDGSFDEQPLRQEVGTELGDGRMTHYRT